MIGVEIKERLGNQLFRYAYARSIQIGRGDRDELLFGLSSFKGKNPDDGWCNQLDDFNIVPARSSGRKLVYSEGSLTQKILLGAYYADMKLLRKPHSLKERHQRQNQWNHILQKHGLLVAYDNKYEASFPLQGNIFLEGSFENPKYFDAIRPALLEELTPRKGRIQDNAALYEAIDKGNAVCVSVRRGDFLSPQFRDVFDVCSADYYRKAMEKMRELAPDCRFIFFSDDVEWVKANLAGPEDLCESGNDPNWEKLRLMYSCRHFIICNSSFAWWAQYLGRSKDKIVLSPDRWYNDDRPQELLLDSFIKIEV